MSISLPDVQDESEMSIQAILVHLYHPWRQVQRGQVSINCKIGQ